MADKPQIGGVTTADYVDFINYVFGMNGIDRSFDKLLPKLFGKGRSPENNTIFVKDGDRIAAAVGVFPLRFSVAGEEFSVGGIGNVAVHPRDRSKGYMKSCMAAATERMIAEGCDFSVLSGKRHRYAYFGYQKCSNEYYLEVTPKTVRYVEGDREPTLRLRTVGREDDALLDGVQTLHDARRYRTERGREDLYDILVSWQATPYAFLDGERPVGFAVVGGHGVLDFALEDLRYLPDALILLSRQVGSVCYHIPLWERSLRDAIWRYAETCLIGADICFSVFRWTRLVGALMRLRAETSPICDGVCRLLVHGKCGDERIEITVKDGVPTVSTPDEDAPIDAELDHLRAMDALFLNVSAERDCLPPAAASWFPLPLSIRECDNV